MLQTFLPKDVYDILFFFTCSTNVTFGTIMGSSAIKTSASLVSCKVDDANTVSSSDT